MKTLIFLFISLVSSIVVADISKTAEDVSPLDVGDRIPNVVLKDSEGQSFDLNRQVGKKPAVLIFYRGSWCPYCNRHLASLMEIEEELETAGLMILAISPDKPAGLKEAAEKNSLGYTLLSDSTAEAIEAFGLGFRVSEKTRELYKSYNIDLAEASGNEHFVLPVPAVYLVDTEGTIVYRHYNPNYKERLAPGDILSAAKALDLK